MAVSTIKAAGEVDPVQSARVDLAAAHRLGVLHSLEEGIDNHFTVTVPGHNDRYFFLPFGLHWSEARASDLIVFSEDGHLFEGAKGDLELSAQVIHAPIHRITGAKVVMHTHQHWALALNMLEDNKLISANQTSAIYFDNQVAYDDDYTGAATTLSEGERLCSALGDKHTLFMKNHGVLVVGSTVAEAYHRLYLLERVCRVQVLAMATDKTIVPIPKETIDKSKYTAGNDPHSPTLRTELFFDAMKRVLDRELPGYAD